MRICWVFKGGNFTQCDTDAMNGARGGDSRTGGTSVLPNCASLFVVAQDTIAEDEKTK